MGTFEVLIIMLIFICAFLVVEISSVKKKLVRLVQENAVMWQIIREHKNK